MQVDLSFQPLIDLILGSRELIKAKNEETYNQIRTATQETLEYLREVYRSLRDEDSRYSVSPSRVLEQCGTSSEEMREIRFNESEVEIVIEKL